VSDVARGPIKIGSLWSVVQFSPAVSRVPLQRPSELRSLQKPVFSSAVTKNFTPQQSCV